MPESMLRGAWDSFRKLLADMRPPPATQQPLRSPATEQEERETCPNCGGELKVERWHVRCSNCRTVVVW